MSEPAPESPFLAADRLFAGVQKFLRPGTDYALGPKGVTVAHFSVTDTPLAAALATMGIPLRDKAPFTDDVGLDQGGNDVSQRKAWWLGDSDPGGIYHTEAIAEAWYHRAAFEAANPLHPLNAMRAAIDARSWWIDVLHAWKAHRAILPIEVRAKNVRTKNVYTTDSLHGAAVLKACGFQPLAFNRHGFSLEGSHARLAAVDILALSAQAEGAIPCMWMARVLRNLSEMLKHIRASNTIIRQELEANTTLLLSVEASDKTRDRFLALT